MKWRNLTDIETARDSSANQSLRVNPRIHSHGQLFTFYNIGFQTVVQKSQIGTVLACFSAQRREGLADSPYRSSNIPARWRCVDVADQTQYISQEKLYQSHRCAICACYSPELDGKWKHKTNEVMLK